MFTNETAITFGQVYTLPKTIPTVNEDLRKVNRESKEYIALFESIKKEGILDPITVWKTTDKEGEIIYRTVTGNRRIDCASRIKKITEIDVIFQNYADEKEYIKNAFHLNIHKGSPVSELVPYFRVLVNEGKSPKQIASMYSLSVKVINEALKLSTDDRLTDIAKASFKNAVHMASNKKFLDNKEILNIAKTGTIDDLKNKIAAVKKAIKLTKSEQEGKTEEPKEKVFVTDRINEFVTQLNLYIGVTMDTAAVKSFLYGDTEKWY